MNEFLINTDTTVWEESELIVNLSQFNSCVVQIKTIEGEFSSAVLTPYISIDKTEWFIPDVYEVKGTDSPYFERIDDYTLEADGLSDTIDLKGCSYFRLKVTTLNGSSHKIIVSVIGTNKLLTS
jgi:hypothetical protein